MDFDIQLRNLADSPVKKKIEKKVQETQSIRGEVKKLLSLYYHNHPTKDLVRNYQRDSQLISKALEVTTYENTQLGIHYLHYHNIPSLHNLIENINLAVQIQETKRSALRKNTPAYLVMDYYTSFGLKLTSPNLIRDTQQIQHLLTELGLETTIALLESMKKMKVPDFRMIRYHKNAFLLGSRIYEEGDLDDLTEI